MGMEKKLGELFLKKKSNFFLERNNVRTDSNKFQYVEDCFEVFIFLLYYEREAGFGPLAITYIRQSLWSKRLMPTFLQGPNFGVMTE